MPAIQHKARRCCSAGIFSVALCGVAALLSGCESESGGSGDIPRSGLATTTSSTTIPATGWYTAPTTSTLTVSGNLVLALAEGSAEDFMDAYRNVSNGMEQALKESVAAPLDGVDAADVTILGVVAIGSNARRLPLFLRSRALTDGTRVEVQFKINLENSGEGVDAMNVVEVLESEAGSTSAVSTFNAAIASTEVGISVAEVAVSATVINPVDTSTSSSDTSTSVPDSPPSASVHVPTSSTSSPATPSTTTPSSSSSSISSSSSTPSSSSSSISSSSSTLSSSSSSSGSSSSSTSSTSSSAASEDSVAPEVSSSSSSFSSKTTAPAMSSMPSSASSSSDAAPISTTATTSEVPESASSTSTATADSQWPLGLMQCTAGTAPTATTSLTCAQYDAVVETFRSMYDQIDDTCTADYCPQADWAGCVLRVAGHDLMDYSDGEGGSDGCLDLLDADNAGLPECLHSGEFGFSIDDAYQTYCTEISLADFIVLAAEAVIAISREHVSGSASLDLRSNFRFGRTTASTFSFAEGRLPNPEESCTAVEETFVDRMGLSWREAAALMGVHTLGRARPENSGYDGWWSDAENSRKFNNNYYVSMLAKGWMPDTLSADKHQWRRSDLGSSAESSTGKEMMLNTDLCLVYTADNRGNVELRAQDTDCCAWVDADIAETSFDTYLGGEFCGSTNVPRGGGDQRENCCDGERDNDIDCGDFEEPEGNAFDAVLDFANDEQTWLTAFETAWTIATENGFSTLQSLSQCE